MSTQKVRRPDIIGDLELAVEEAARITGADGAAIAIGSPSGMCCCANAGDAPDIGVALSPDSGLSGVCLRTAQVVHCDDTANDSRVDPEAARRMHFRSVLIVPILVGGSLQAVLEVMSAKPRAFNVRHREDLSRMALGISTLLSEGSPEKQATSPAQSPHRLPPSAAVGNQIEPAVAAGNAAASTVSAADQRPLRPAATLLSAATHKPATSVPTAATRDPAVRATAAGAARSEHRVAPRSAQIPFSTAIKAGVAVVVLALVAIGWYVASGSRTAVDDNPATPKSSTAAPATSAHNAELPPEISVEQNSLSVAGPEETTKATGSAPQLTPGKLTRMVDPVYPDAARARGISGSVALTALVTKEGRVANVNFLRGPDVLAVPVVSAVRQWVYEPYRVDGVPVAVETMIVIKFTPRNQP